MTILLTNSTDIFAGGEDYVLILARHLRSRGHTVLVSARPGHLLLEKCTSEGIPTVPVEYGPMGRVFAVSGALARSIRAHRVDVLHSNANYDRTCAALAGARTGRPHVAGVHSAHSIQHNLTHWLRNRWGIDHFIADAEAVKSVLVEQDRIPPDRVTVVPIGVEEDDPETRHSRRAAMRRELGVPESTVVIGNVARLVPFKGHRFLLAAIAIVAARRPDVLFPIVGDGELLEDLRAQTDALGIGGAVRFLGFRDNLHEIYPAFDIYTHSSLELAAEAFPIAILRALGTGLPIVCTAVGGIPLMVDDERSGYLVPPENPAALADALMKVVTDAPLRSSMGAASAALFRRRYHASAMAENVERIYQRCLSAS